MQHFNWNKYTLPKLFVFILLLYEYIFELDIIPKFELSLLTIFALQWVTSYYLCIIISNNLKFIKLDLFQIFK